MMELREELYANEVSFYFWTVGDPEVIQMGTERNQYREVGECVRRDKPA
jgi:hypothetical protein